MKTNKNEELQSRREFFKSAAKVALPVLGVAILSQLPIAAQASPSGCMGCSGGCMATCKYTCSNTSCKGGCTGTCKGSGK